MINEENIYERRIPMLVVYPFFCSTAVVVLLVFHSHPSAVMWDAEINSLLILLEFSRREERRSNLRRLDCFLLLFLSRGRGFIALIFKYLGSKKGQQRVSSFLRFSWVQVKLPHAFLYFAFYGCRFPARFS